MARPMDDSRLSPVWETMLGALVALLVVWGVCGAPLP